MDREKIMEAACEVCRWPFQCESEDELNEEHCSSCPVAAAMGMTVTGVYDQEEVHLNCTVVIWSNSETGEQSIGWWENGSPPDGQ